MGESAIATMADLFSMRVIQKNLVYVIGIPQKYADENILRRNEFFGQFGSIKKIIVNRRSGLLEHKTVDSRSIEATASAYITFASVYEARWCIHEIDESLLDAKVIRCTYGTTKYCSFYLKGVPCQNNECMYLHVAKPACDVLTKEELVGTKHRLHDFDPKNKNAERLGHRQQFGFVDELLRCKHDVVYNPPKNILFKPMDFSRMNE